MRGPGPGPGHESAVLASPSRGARPRPSPWRGSRTTSCWWRSGRTRAVSAGARPRAEGRGPGAGEGQPGRRGSPRVSRAPAALVWGPGSGVTEGRPPRGGQRGETGRAEIAHPSQGRTGPTASRRRPGGGRALGRLGLPTPSWVGWALSALADCRAALLPGARNTCKPLL